jgi:chromosome segregation ATPase
MESESVAQLHTLKVSLDAAMQRVQAYEALEIDIDQAIVCVAQDTIHPTENQKSGESTLSLVHGLQRGLIPSDPQRRVRQAVFLAQQLLKSDQRLKEALLSLNKTESMLQANESEIERLKIQLSRCSQPAIYLTEKLQREEYLRVSAEQELLHTQQEMRNLRDKAHALHKDCVGLRERLKLLLNQKGELQTIKHMLRHFDEQQDSDDGSDIDDSGKTSDHAIGQNTLSTKTNGIGRNRSIDGGVVESKVNTPPRILSTSTPRSPKVNYVAVDDMSLLACRLQISPDTLLTMITPPPRSKF